MKAFLCNRGGHKYTDIIKIMIFVSILVITVSFIRIKTGDELEYRNSDATYHTLLTIEAYDQTPMSKHLYLPIVSLGKSDDKWIPWGATIPDKEGNYYYTSFSPAGYYLPWLFMKIFRLPDLPPFYVPRGNLV